MKDEPRRKDTEDNKSYDEDFGIPKKDKGAHEMCAPENR